MSTDRGITKKSHLNLRSSDEAMEQPRDLSKTLSQHAHSQALLEQQQLEISHGLGSDGEEIKSPTRGVNTNNSNDSVPVRSAQDHSKSQQSYSYDFLYDPEIAKHGSSVSYKNSDAQSAAGQSQRYGDSAASPHVFMLSADEYNRNNRSSTTSVPGGVEGGRLSLLSRSSLGQTSNGGRRNSTNDAAPSQQQAAAVSKYVDQMGTEVQDEEQYVEEEYYIEEEVEESAEEEQSVQTRGVETIKEVSSDQENGSPSDMGDKRNRINEPLGSIMQTVSISPTKQRHVESAGQSHIGVSHSQKGMSASDFKDYKCNSSSKKTDSNMASLVFRPKDSDTATLPQHHSISINSNGSHHEKISQPRSSIELPVMQGSHLSSAQSMAGTSTNQAVIQNKWGNILEKCAMKMISRDVYAQLNKIGDVLSRRLIQQELILNNQSHMQLKSFLEISVNSTERNMVMTPREQQECYYELRQRTPVQVQNELVNKLGRLTSNLTDYFRGEAEIFQSMAQERERNIFLEAELSSREDRIRPAQINADDSNEEEQDMQATEQFISELEEQLQKARADLLSAKLTISDQTVEIENLKVKNEIVSNQVNHFLEERRHFEESFENLRQQLGALQSEKLELSQMIRDRENTMGPNMLQSAINHTAGYSSNQDYSNRQSYPLTHEGRMNTSSNNNNLNQTQDLLKQQVATLNRAVFEATKKHESLQLVENTLLEKLDKKEMLNMDLKEGLSEVSKENEMKSDVISKAQKIIERLTLKSGSDDNVLQRLNDEKEDQKRELSEKTKSIQLLSEQLEEVKNKQNHDSTIMKETMTRELEEVRNAVRDYQFELGSEKQNYAVRLAALQDELQHSNYNCQQLRETSETLEVQAKNHCESSDNMVKQLSERLRISEATNSDLKEEMKKQVDLVEESAKNQIKYLQIRIKEIVEETGENQSVSLKRGGNTVSKKMSLLTTIKNELESMSKEVLSMRDALRTEGNRRDSLVNQKMNKFEEFRLSVIDQLVLWDEKTAELSGLAERYSGALDEQKRLFMKLKLVVQEKDQVITELHRQLAMRELSQEQNFETIKLELERNNRLMYEEMFSTIALLEQKVLLREKECLEAEERKIEHRREFTKLLEERNYYEQRLNQGTEILKYKESEVERLSIEKHEQDQRYGEILNVHSLSVSADSIEVAMKNATDDARRFHQEMVNYRDSLMNLEKDRDEERLLLNQKVGSLEESYAALQKQAIDKDEEQQLDFVERESGLQSECAQLKTYADKIEAELQTRERQLKKIQDKIDADDKCLQDAQANIEIVAAEKMEALAQNSATQQTNEKLIDDIECLQDKLSQQEDLTISVRREVQKEQQTVSEKVGQILELEAQIKNLEDEIAFKVREQEIQEGKLRAIDARNSQTSKDLQEIYKELAASKSAKANVENAKNGLTLEVQSLKSLISKNNSEMEQKDEELTQYQKTVMRQTRELEKAQSEAAVAQNAKQRLKEFDETIQDQSLIIEQLRSDLRGPTTTVNGTQTIDSGMIEIEYARQEVIKSQRCQEVVYQENVQLKDALQRSSFEICRLIEDKRELEDLIEKLNKSIGMFRQQHQTRPATTSSGKGTFIASETLTATSGNGANGEEVMGRMLAEKENYIGGLENEISEMRKEIEVQRDQLLHAEVQTIDVKANQSIMSQSVGTNNPGAFISQSYQPSSPQYMYNAGFIQQSRDASQAGQTLRQQFAPQRSSSRDRYPNMNEMAYQEVPTKLQPQTMNYSTLSRSLTPAENITTSEEKDKHSGYFNNNPNNLSIAMTNNQTQASAMMLNQTHYNSQVGRHQDNASYLNPNQSSVLMNYQTAGAMNQSVMTNPNDRSMWACEQRQNTSQAQISGMAQGSPPGKDGVYRNFIHA